jgi:signal transduction histidine kinase
VQLSLLRYFPSLRILLSIIAGFLIFVSIASYIFFIDISSKINNIAIQNIKYNTELETEELSISLSNKIESITTNLEILRNSPSIILQLDLASNILNAAQYSTGDLTNAYVWTNKNGEIIWSSNFINKTSYEKFKGQNISERDQFRIVKSTLKPYFSTVIDSITNIPTVFISYPILIDNTSIDNSSSSYLQISRIQEQQQPQQQQQQSQINNTFSGVIFAAINSSSIINYLNNKITPNNQSSINLIDKDGLILFSSNAEFNNVVVDSKNYKEIMKKYLDEQNQETLSKAMKKVFNEETGSVEIINKSGSSSTIAYTPVYLNGQIIFYVTLNTLHNFATEVDDLIRQQQNFTMGSLFAIGIIAFLISIIMGLFNRKLRGTVEDRTKDLKTAINSLENANEQLKEHDLMQREFINIAAHELRTPTQSIVGYLELLKNFPENFKKYLEPLERNSQRLYRLTEDILDIARIESNNLKLKKESFEIRNLIKETIDDFKNKYKNTQKNDFEIINSNGKNNLQNKEIFVKADKVRIQQVILNLLSNAYKFTENGKIIININKNDNQIYIKVQDNGQGIHHTILPRLFGKFATKSEIGTGLGLYISKNIVEAHGGSIKGYNNPDGKGATFEFILPIGNIQN